jgi:hypothetical protein
LDEVVIMVAIAPHAGGNHDGGFDTQDVFGRAGDVYHGLGNFLWFNRVYIDTL